MTKDEVIDKITSTHKWYVYIGWSQQKGFETIRRYKDGTLSEKKINELFSVCGFEKTKDAEYSESEFLSRFKFKTK